MPRKPANPDQIVPSVISIRTDGMQPDVLDKLGDFIKADGIRSATTIASTALLAYCGVISADVIDITPYYVKTLRRRSTIKLTPEQKAERQRAAAEEKRLQTHKALKFMEFVSALASRGESLDAKNMQAFEAWFAKQPPPAKRERKNKVVA